MINHGAAMDSIFAFVMAFGRRMKLLKGMGYPHDIDGLGGARRRIMVVIRVTYRSPFRNVGRKKVGSDMHIGLMRMIMIFFWLKVCRRVPKIAAVDDDSHVGRSSRMFLGMKIEWFSLLFALIMWMVITVSRRRSGLAVAVRASRRARLVGPMSGPVVVVIPTTTIVGAVFSCRGSGLGSVAVVSSSSLTIAIVVIALIHVLECSNNLL
jgi:hypothetical protein